jgi:hypothetical protein
MALNFGILQPVNVGGQFMAGRQQAQEQVQKNELAQQQLAASKQQMAGAELTQRHTQMQMDQLQRDRDALTKMQEQFVANGKSPDLESNADAMIASGIQHYVDLGSKIKQKVLEQKQFANIMGGGTFDPNAPAPVAPMNALAPAAAAPAAPVNALAPTAGLDQGAINEMRRKRDQLLAMGTTQSIAAAGALDRDIALTSKEPVYHNVPGVGLVDPRTNRIVTAEGVKPTDLQRNYEYAKGQGFKGDIFEYERKLKEASRAPAQPVAPTITQIVDPSNPNQMITIDARRYQGGGVGSAGVLGVGGKEPTAALRTNKVEAGKTQLADELDNLRASFQTLNTMRAIPSTGRNVISNIGSATAATGFGQMLGRAGGTEAQVERDVINSARMRLTNSIKNATGMSAQQLNSNVELQTMLKSISDPGQSVEAAMRIIDDIENAYVKGNGKPAAAPAAGGATGEWKVVK